MKTRFILYILPLLLLAGCSLEEDRESFADRANSYQNSFQAEAVVKSCYEDVAQLFNSSSAMMMEVASDLWYQSTSVVDAISAISPARSGQASRIWQRCYNGIMRANEVIECVLASDIDEEDKMAIQAEARVLRAFFYYYLTNTFNGVPFYTCMVKDMQTMEMIRTLPRTDARIIRTTLYEDLRDNAIPYLPEIRANEVKGNRMGYAMGLMLMGKFAMWNKEWTLALEPLQKLESLYGTLDEANYPLEETVWWKKNTKESIFEVQHEWKADGIQFTSTVCTNMYPVIASDGSLDGVVMPQWGERLSSHTCARATWHFAAFRLQTIDINDTTSVRKPSDQENENYMNSIFDPLPLECSYEIHDYMNSSKTQWKRRYKTQISLDAVKNMTIRGKKVDRRVFYVLGFGNLETGETFRNVAEEGLAFGGMKFWIPNRTANYDSNNYKIFRYADAVLMMAECWCNAGNYEKALEYLNYTRARAGVDGYDVSEYPDQDSIMKLVRDERARELGGELHRRYDLVRWGIWYKEVTKRQNSGVTILNNIQPYHEYYPIPDTQCALSGYVLNNPEYGFFTGEDGSTGEDE